MKSSRRGKCLRCKSRFAEPLGRERAMAVTVSQDYEPNYYLCPGFYPLSANNLMHAAFLFAVWSARRTFGPGAMCTRLMLLTEPGSDGAIFKVSLTIGVLSKACLLTVLAHSATPELR